MVRKMNWRVPSEGKRKSIRQFEEQRRGGTNLGSGEKTSWFPGNFKKNLFFGRDWGRATSEGGGHRLPLPKLVEKFYRGKGKDGVYIPCIAPCTLHRSFTGIYRCSKGISGSPVVN